MSQSIRGNQIVQPSDSASAGASAGQNAEEQQQQQVSIQHESTMSSRHTHPSNDTSSTFLLRNRRLAIGRIVSLSHEAQPVILQAIASALTAHHSIVATAVKQTSHRHGTLHLN